ncbi:hypothetical protein NQT66_14935 [Cellulophaga baltica]|uniref:hypothetical protein n=1 Tax=Cellulophaga baltica TaxID=76594 RepID=UPI002149236B|nr:hypothetical protein [Cellulophaga baltica]MCR1026115.1 hypothetical protein [Cellulophaga baltica]
MRIFIDSAKSLGYCFKQGKEKTKQKNFATCVAESKRQFAPVLFIAKPLPHILKNNNLEHKISESTSNLIDMANDICWNQISRNCEYIMSEINENIESDYSKIAKKRKNINEKKVPKSLNGIIAELSSIYDNLYDINLHIHKAQSERTIIEIRYFLKTSHTEEFYPKIKENEPMLHCKVAIPPYRIKNKKFDVNWELGGIRHQWNKFLMKNNLN